MLKTKQEIPALLKSNTLSKDTTLVYVVRSEGEIVAVYKDPQKAKNSGYKDITTWIVT